MGRECGWTRQDLAEFTPHQLAEIVREVAYQRQFDLWERAYPVAQGTAILANVHRKKGAKGVKPEDFIGKRPKKEKVKARPSRLADLVEEAKAKGLWVPKSEFG